MEISPDGTPSERWSNDGSNLLTVFGSVDHSKPHTRLRMEDGRVVQLPTNIFLESGRDEKFKEELPKGPNDHAQEPLVIPVVEEELRVEKRTVVTGKITIDKQIVEYQEELNVPLAIRTFEIERVVLNQPVDAAPPVRQEGFTTIYSFVEEKVVVTTQLILIEELRVTQRDVEASDRRTVTLQRDLVNVLRSE